MEANTKKKRNKKLWIPVIVLVLLAVLFVPVPSGVYKDGGTRAYTAMTYKAVKWNRILGAGGEKYTATRVYFFPKNFQSIDTLWETWEMKGVDLSAYKEPEPKEEEHFEAKILELSVVSAKVEVIEEGWNCGNPIVFPVKDLDPIDAEVGDIVEVFYNGIIKTSYPAGISASSWRLSEKNREQTYPGQWLDKTTAGGYDSNIFNFTDLRITKIYSDCFFARPLPIGQAIKLNGKISDDWCIGDSVVCTYENACYDPKNGRKEADLLTIDVSDWKPEPSEPGETGSFMLYKPVIYLYPEEEAVVSVELTLDGKLTCTYPAYKDGWTVTAMPDGTITDAKGQTYNYLYWEGESGMEYDFSEGFCVKGEDTEDFLEEALASLGLTRREANEFIVFWLPMMEQNPYNIISFQTENYTEAAKLTVSPAPDTVLRVFMAWKGADAFTELPKQSLTPTERTGFTLVEWGGTEVR